jgi:hypothetical protein
MFALFFILFNLAIGLFGMVRAVTAMQEDNVAEAVFNTLLAALNLFLGFC